MISVNWSYLHTSFISKGKKWHLIGCESNGNIENTYDTFKSEDGNYQTAMRKQIKKLCDEKSIIPI